MIESQILRNQYFQLNYKHEISSKNTIANIKLKHLQLVKKNSGNNEDDNPTYREIANLKQQLKILFYGNTKKINQIINQLYCQFIVPKQLSSKTPKPQNYNHVLQVSDKKISLRRYRLTALRPQHKRLDSDAQKKDLARRQLVVRALVYRNYGIAHLQQEMRQMNSKITIHRKQYKNICCAVVTQAYRHLESFLNQECHRLIKPINRLEIRSISTILCRARDYFTIQSCLAFMKFLKLAFGIQNVYIGDVEASNLYMQIQCILRARIGDMQLDIKTDKVKLQQQKKSKEQFRQQKQFQQQIWTIELERQLLLLYDKNHLLTPIKQHFQKKYPKYRRIFTVLAIRSKLYKIIRISLKKLHCLAIVNNIPHYEKINDQQSKMIMRAPEALQIRRDLLKVYLLKDDVQYNLIQRLMRKINAFSTQTFQARMKQIVQSIPETSSTFEKINYNMKIAKAKCKQNSYRCYGGLDQIYLKERTDHFHHIVHIDKGQNLHFYRKIEKQQNNRADISQPNIKQQQQEDYKSEQSTLKIQEDENTLQKQKCIFAANIYGNGEMGQQIQQQIELRKKSCISKQEIEDLFNFNSTQLHKSVSNKTISPLQQQIKLQIKLHMPQLYTRISMYQQ